ncbi:hypothetical protein BAE44_0024079 [Dichanthelium oligosanthes]|uniref:Uncharacterized protein n=1 Tax=Dichanthelium oligosanthes TaxID=888268 RepID=A0A1E5UPW1_9POAL|nr:hypothetical protein BAE44_0024079 [Dichanthelium oligosanthes]
MRREGRQHGWVYAVDRILVDPEGKRRAVHAVEGSSTANGGFVRAPRKPTNHSKPTGGRAYRELSGKGGSSGKVRHKFKHEEVKMYYREGADGAAADVYDMDT